jgi:hypothetical protein
MSKKNKKALQAAIMNLLAINQLMARLIRTIDKIVHEEELK